MIWSARAGSRFFFNDTATTEIYTLSLHDALPICRPLLGVLRVGAGGVVGPRPAGGPVRGAVERGDRKSTRLNSSHANISYAVFCLKKKNLSTPAKRTMTTRHSSHSKHHSSALFF